jgi:hypothetical protein
MTTMAAAAEVAASTREASTSNLRVAGDRPSWPPPPPPLLPPPLPSRDPDGSSRRTGERRLYDPARR